MYACVFVSLRLHEKQISKNREHFSHHLLKKYCESAYENMRIFTHSQIYLYRGSLKRTLRRLNDLRDFFNSAWTLNVLLKKLLFKFTTCCFATSECLFGLHGIQTYIFFLYIFRIFFSMLYFIFIIFIHFFCITIPCLRKSFECVRFWDLPYFKPFP